ncbi:hypothetical protein ALI144C_23445 [Actinosynnema sp. ALI-1.44]|uniref:hypothetical protein n=1 Tax=Actinosynnema sp. ALI-1.44 TaxID=1933779 RepID=UPI00097C11B1|nr:hypothetical protein [Actinosynnema sp. ALI-1.44]ONI79716.1 hypothetical protein ALI144C_23445 [Actinosynnema sp. ALI-1.44]
MGVLTDYFRAPDGASVVRELDRADAMSPVGPFPGVETKGVDPDVVLGMLIAAIRQVPWEVNLVGSAVVWPTTPPGPQGPEDEDDPWATGPWVMELDDAVRDTLAAVPDADVPAVVTEWVRAEELHGTTAEDIRPFADDLIQLARQARDSGERVYCWTCL